MVLLVSLLVASLPLAACQKIIGDNQIPLGDPTVAPPTITSPGVLRVGVDASHAPYAGRSSSKIVGLDVDIAAAMADALGLKLEIIDITDADVTELFVNQRVDIVMGYHPEPGTVSPYVLVGPYLSDGPAVFTKGLSLPAAGFDPESLRGMKIAAQTSSLSAWQVTERYGSDALQTYANLEEVFAAVDTGAISYAAADVVVGAYLASKCGGIISLGYLAEPTAVFIAVAPGNQEMTDTAVATLRTLRNNGVLETIVTKWLGPTASNLTLNSNAITEIGVSGSNSGTDLGNDLPDPANSNPAPETQNP